MFKDLIMSLSAVSGLKIYQLYSQIGYNSPSALQKVISGNDIRLTVLLNVCRVLGYTITIQNNKGFSLNLNEYYNQQQQTEETNK